MDFTSICTTALYDLQHFLVILRKIFVLNNESKKTLAFRAITWYDENRMCR